LLTSLITPPVSIDIEWGGLWRAWDQPNGTFEPLATGIYPNLAWPIEIYRDVATTAWIYGGNFTVDEYGYANLMYKISNSSTAAIAVIGMTPEDSFETQISFKQADEGKITKQPLFAYPFDEVSIGERCSDRK
jgi:hypothetical protein